MKTKTLNKQKNNISFNENFLNNQNYIFWIKERYVIWNLFLYNIWDWNSKELILWFGTSLLLWVIFLLIWNFASFWNYLKAFLFFLPLIILLIFFTIYRMKKSKKIYILKKNTFDYNNIYFELSSISKKTLNKLKENYFFIKK